MRRLIFSLLVSHQIHLPLNAFVQLPPTYHRSPLFHPSVLKSTSTTTVDSTNDTAPKKTRNVFIIGAGWGGLSAAYHLTKSSSSSPINVTLVDAAPRVGGLVRDGYITPQKRRTEAGQHGFWDNYHNIFNLLENDLNIKDTVLTDYAEQGQYSPRGREAVWPVYRDQTPALPTGLAQLAYTRFETLPLLDRVSALPLVLAFSEFDDSEAAWERYDGISFRDLCVKLGVSRRCYEEAFEPMILTGLFAPGRECSAAAALGMAYFFVMKSQNSFDVRWCRGNIGEKVFDPWLRRMTTTTEQDEDGNNSGNPPVTLLSGNKVVGFGVEEDRITSLTCRDDGVDTTYDVDDVIFAVGANALKTMVRYSPSSLGRFGEFRRFANLRGTSVLATRLYLDGTIDIPYSANAVWGFDEGVGQTFFDISALHGTTDDEVGTVVEVDYYHANRLLAMSDEAIVRKAKSDLDTMLGPDCAKAKVLDAAVVRLPEAVNWYFPGSYADMPDTKSSDVSNAYFVGDLVRSRHGSWSQEKAYVTGMEAANIILGRDQMEGIIPLSDDEPHVMAARKLVAAFKQALGGPKSAPSLVDFLW